MSNNGGGYHQQQQQQQQQQIQLSLSTSYPPTRSGALAAPSGLHDYNRHSLAPSSGSGGTGAGAGAGGRIPEMEDDDGYDQYEDGDQTDPAIHSQAAAEFVKSLFTPLLLLLLLVLTPLPLSPPPS